MLVHCIVCVVHFQTLDGVAIALKPATECHTSAIGEDTQWKSESGTRKVKVIKKLNVCFQYVSFCIVEQVDEVTSSAHRNRVTKVSTKQ